VTVGERCRRKTDVTDPGIVRVPSRRELLGESSRSGGVRWSEFRWKRILAFVGGAAVTALYLWLDPFQYVPDWTAAAAGSVPVGLLLYSLSSQSWQTCARVAVGTAVGMGLATYL
jgi:hypothetical protein